jgi:hypothetical protein
MAKPIAPAKGVAMAFPDVCNTPAPPSSPVPIPYPNIAQLGQASPVTDAGGKELLIGPAGDYALLKGSKVNTSSGDEAGSAGGLSSGGIKGPCEITGGSSSVVYGPDGIGVARFLETTSQNDGNATGTVLSAFPMVLVGD